jgi:acyl dehydratase
LIDSPPPGASHELELRFSQRDFDVFARISGDDNPIHVDPEFSARTRFCRTVAHGMFIFGHFAAATARWLSGPTHVLDQRLIFNAPTFAEDDLRLRLEVVETAGATVTLTQQLFDSRAVRTAAGTTVIGRNRQQLPLSDLEQPSPSPPFKGIEVGMQASMRRTFTPADVSQFCRLVNDPNPRFAGREPWVPPALLGGVVSCLLGVELPGPGANWLKQHYRFLHPVPTHREVETTIGVNRLRPAKALVNLHNTAAIAGRTVMVGETLVLAADVSDRRR